jgi:LacI family transcriptional regulator, gluconate utilization system Gnt-I transcriptional repressor
MAAGNNRPRMSDVAAAAGVALVTVSRVLNEPDKVKPETLARVQAAIDELGYVPDLTAGSLASSRSFMVGAIVPTLANAWFADAMEGLAAELAPLGYQLMVAQSQYHPQSEAGLVDAFLGRRVDAVVLTGRSHPREMREKLRRQGIPVVEIWDLPKQPIDMSVGFSHTALGAEVARHLRERGHEHVGFIGADEERSRLRLQGLCEGLGVADVPAEFIPPPSSIEAGEEATELLRARAPQLTAVFCSTDLLAIGALMHCRARRVKVPAQLAVVGFSDLPIARAMSPALSTIRIEAMELGKRAGQLLRQRFAGVPLKPVDRVIDLGFRLVARESS